MMSFEELNAALLFVGGWCNFFERTSFCGEFECTWSSLQTALKEYQSACLYQRNQEICSKSHPTLEKAYSKVYNDPDAFLKKASKEYETIKSLVLSGKAKVYSKEERKKELEETLALLTGKKSK